MRITWAGTFEPDFSRNRKLARLLQLSGNAPMIIREDLWGRDRIGLAGGGLGWLALRAAVRYGKLLFRLLFSARPDVYLVSYPGWFDVPLVRLVAWIKRRPLVFDPFISLYDTMISDRRLSSPHSTKARLASMIDRLSLRLSNFVIADTPTHLDFYDQIAPGVETRGGVIPLGADDDIFNTESEVEVDPELVTFHGTFVPLQGLATIAEAAALLKDTGIRIVIFGDGQDRPMLERTLDRTGAVITLPGLLPLNDLPSELSQAAVCLGIFGESDKAGRVVPHKLYECLALGRPVITRSGPAVEALFKDDELVMVPPQDPERLADAIKSLIDDPERRERVARAGHSAYLDRFHEEPLAKSLEILLDRAIGAATPVAG